MTVTAALVAVLATGCGAPTNRLEEKSATEVLDAATAAIDGASGVHVTGSGISGGRKLSANMEKDLRRFPTNLTPSTMVALGEQLCGCSSELARIGSPAPSSADSCTRRKGVRRIRRRGAVFRHGRWYRHPVHRTAAEREQTQALECGFAASGNCLILLVQALNQGAEITKATS
jgi:hypothetical protein